jgi:transcriptional regulator with XRE-family HTH domain
MNAEYKLLGVGEKIHAAIPAKEKGNVAKKAGMSRNTLWRIMTGQTVPDMAQLTAIAEAIGKPLSTFIPSSITSEFPPQRENIGDLPTIPWNELKQLSPEVTDKPLTTIGKGATVFNVIIRDTENEPDFRVGDILTISLDAPVGDGCFYIIFDKDQRRAVLRQLKKFGKKMVIRTTNLRIEDAFDPRRYQIIAKVTKHARDLS